MTNRRVVLDLLTMRTAAISMVIAVTLWAAGPAGSASTKAPPTSLPLLRGAEKELVTLIHTLGRTVVAVTAWRQMNWSGQQQGQSSAGRLTPAHGSGFIISPGGEIVTNEHVLRHAKVIKVTLWTGKEYLADVIGTDSRSDLAVIRIPEKNLPAAKLGDLKRVRRGQWALALGNPFGLSEDGQAAASLGIVSAIGRHVPYPKKSADRFYGNLIQTTAQITIGNSGGPLFNLDGEVIAINTIIPTTDIGGTQHMAFAISMCDWTKRIIQQLRSGMTIQYGYLGISLANRPGRGGAVVVEVKAGTPASQVNLHAQDVVLEYDGVKVKDVDHLIMLISQTLPGKQVTLKIQRTGSTLSKSVRVARRKEFVQNTRRPRIPATKLKGHTRQK